VQREVSEVEQSYTVDDLSEMSLEELLNIQVVTGSKGAVSARQSPSILTVFTRRQIDDLGAFQLIDLLQHVPGFYEVSAQYGRNVAIRGIHGPTAQHVVVLRDGISIADFLTATAPLSVPLDDVERVEVVRGPGSALYGGNALMGVINLITRSAEAGENTRVHTSLGTDGFYRAGITSSLPFTAEDGATRGLFLSASIWEFKGTRLEAKGDESILFPARGVNNSDGLVDGETYTLPNPTIGIRASGQDLSGYVSGRFDASESLVIRGSFEHSASHLQRTYRQMLIAERDRQVADLYRTQRLHLDVEKSWGKSDEIGRLVLHPFLNLTQQSLDSQRLPLSTYDDALREQQSVLFGFSGEDQRVGGTLDYYIDLPSLGVFEENSLLIGAQAEHAVATGYGLNRCFVDGENGFLPSRFNQPGGADTYCVDTVMLNEGTTLTATEFEDTDTTHAGDGQEQLLAGYAQVSSELSIGTRIVVGGRVDHKDGFEPRVSPRFALMQPLPNDFYLKGQFANAFVYPAFLYRSSNDFSHYEGNPEIKQQSITNVEAQVGYAGSEFIQPEVSAYHYRVKDFITFDLEKNARTGRYRFDNQGEIQAVGVEGSLAFAGLDGMLSGRVNGSFTKPLSSTSPEFLVEKQLGGPTKFPAFVGDLVLKVQPIDALSLIGTVNYNTEVKHNVAEEARFEAVVGTDGDLYSSRENARYKTGGVALLGAGVIWDWRQLTLSVHGKNLLNAAYHRPGSVLVPYYGEGRRLMATAAYQF
jgi:outer membrane receptor protein involved in Fe transport